MRWIQRTELGEFKGLSEVISGSPSAVGIGVKIADNPSFKEQFILIGYLSRMFLEFMSPSQFLELVRKDFEFAAAGGAAVRCGQDHDLPPLAFTRRFTARRLLAARVTAAGSGHWKR